jgi:hypothetical protein
MGVYGEIITFTFRLKRNELDEILTTESTIVMTKTTNCLQKQTCGLF